MIKETLIGIAISTSTNISISDTYPECQFHPSIYKLSNDQNTKKEAEDLGAVLLYTINSGTVSTLASLTSLKMPGI